VDETAIKTKLRMRQRTLKIRRINNKKNGGIDKTGTGRNKIILGIKKAQSIKIALKLVVF